MISEWFADLDELVLRCRNEQAKQFIAEAVACYRAGAFRSCIVATWTAVVYDFLQKLRELELTGDAKARAHLERFEKIRGDADIPAALVFERNVLSMARNEFELLSPLEYEDLARLLDDRNRCAHPSMNTSEEPYRASPELARYHLRNAVTHMLQHPPVQGKAALDRLIREAFSQYFPIDPLAAITHFQQGPLARPRPALVRNFVLILMKALLLDPTGGDFLRIGTALYAVQDMHRTIAQPVIHEKVNEMLRNLADDELARGVKFLKLAPDVWDVLSTDVRTRLQNFVEDMPDAELLGGLGIAYDVPALREKAVLRIGKLTSMEIAVDLAYAEPLPLLVQRSVELYLEANTFRNANDRGAILSRLVYYLKAENIERVVVGAHGNDQVGLSSYFKTLVRQIRKAQALPDEQLSDLLDNNGFQVLRQELWSEDEGNLH
jgi:hypothetical protein